MRNIAVNQDPAVEALETREWQDSLAYVLQQGGGVRRAADLLRQLEFHARQTGFRLPFTASTPYVNTIPASQQPAFPGQSGHRTPHHEPGSVERALDGRPRQQAQ